MKLIQCVVIGLILSGMTGLLPVFAETPKWLNEVRLGLFLHNIETFDGKNAEKEQDPNIQAELLFSSPDFLRIVKAPRPYLLGTFNMVGDTSYFGGGLNWRLNLGHRFSVEPGIGYVVHTGGLEPPFPRFDPRNVTFNENNILFGSRDLFRTSVSITREFTTKFDVQITLEHLSHGHIIGSGHNQGLDNLGLRLAYKL